MVKSSLQVTGGSSGIGKQVVKSLLEKNATVYLAARNPEKSEKAIEELFELTGKRAVFLKLDLADLLSVKAAAEEFLTKESRLHILFNNGAVMMPAISEVTAQGYDLQFGTNVLGHFYLTCLLLPILLSTAKDCPEGSVRVVNVSSAAHYAGLWQPLDFGTFKDGPRRRRWMTEFLYIQSKFALTVFSTELGRRYGDQGLICISVNPGNLKNTELRRHLRTWWTKLGSAVLMIYPPEWGALTELWAGTSEAAKSLNTKFVGPWCRERLPATGTEDRKLGAELWMWMEEQISIIL